jgi:SAM-dependent methyltransferase
MSNQRNKSGIQLSSSKWLENHHTAKKNLRIDFVKKIVEFNPYSIIDIGCGTGLWLSIFNDILPKKCKFIGVDLDETSLKEAKKRALNWERDCEWIKLDINKTPEKIPSADLALIFNFSSYIENLEDFFANISCKRGFKKIALRQFAGDEIKFGPLNIDKQTAIALSLKDSIGESQQIRYFDMDRLIECAAKSGREVVFREFELFQDFSPFDNSTWPYIKGTVEWTSERMPKYEKKIVDEWLVKATKKDESLYFYSLDWTALLV